MKIKIRRIDASLPLPRYYTKGAVAFDIYARESISIAPFSIFRIPTNLIIQVPLGYMLYLKDRSSTLARKGLLATAGIVDQDYHGPSDEILFQVYNTKNENVEIERGERIGQGVFIKIVKADWHEMHEDMKESSRDGFGSTGE